MPSGNPPHKRHREGRATDEQRVEMLSLATRDNPHFELSQVEMNTEGYTYTYKTLENLCAQHPDTDYYFIIGADSLFTFDSWMEPGRICSACTLVVAVRDHASDQAINHKIRELSQRYHGTFVRLDTDNIDISSNILRNWISEHKSLRYYVPDAVIDYIHAHGIYQA
jgi:nicotinate-nucleotide adenylyltransferase